MRGIVLDFDGTVTHGDIGDLICDHFSPPQWRDIDQRWIRGELSLSEAQRQMWALCQCRLAEAVAYAREVAVLRPGLDQLLSAARAASVQVVLASGGFDFYIEPLLGEERLGGLAGRFYNYARFCDSAGPPGTTGTAIQLDFPHADLSCDRCAICKGKVCQKLRAACGPVAFIGDGYSDRCVLDHGAGQIDALFAVRGSILERLVHEHGRHGEQDPHGERAAPAFVFDDFTQVAQILFGCFRPA